MVCQVVARAVLFVSAALLLFFFFGVVSLYLFLQFSNEREISILDLAGGFNCIEPLVAFLFVCGVFCCTTLFDVIMVCL